VFIVYGRSSGVEGDYLLEQLALGKSDAQRLSGVLLQGKSVGENLARTFDAAGDFNGDGIADVVVGNEQADNGTGPAAGEVIVLLGSSSLESPIGGWTTTDAVNAGVAIRFFSSNSGDLVGANVAGASNVDADFNDVNGNGIRDLGEAGLSDILISAPGAEGGRGAVYLIYGKPGLSGNIDLSLVGTVDLPGVKFVGREMGDQLGAGEKVITGTRPDDPTGTISAYSRGMASLGFIDDDPYIDIAISSMLADPGGKTDAGEVYVIYGRGDPVFGQQQP
jgi:hypothetical protein